MRVAKNAGVVESVDAGRIVIRVTDSKSSEYVDIYNLIKYTRSNQNTCINQRPLVTVGDKVKVEMFLQMDHLWIMVNLHLVKILELHLCHGMDITLRIQSSL
ncbi:MAG: hypothetical protein CM15mP127_07010 [Gammaproteobacteria bacterium]|nr:MAG: hypothetical protein CM15mP127_07010 [Gammaproteobacteria bacterium]